MKNSLVFTFILSVLISYAQDYQISFTGSGESNTVETVLVKNLTQDTEMTLSGTNILHLTTTLGIDNIISFDDSFLVYPNPTRDALTLSIYSKNTNPTTLKVTDINGKQIIQYQENLQVGNNHFTLSGLQQGLYFISLIGNDKVYTKKVVFIGDTNNPTITRNKTTISTNKLSPNSPSVIQMQYNEGDLLLLTATIGVYSRIIMLTPTENTNINFNFVAATDIDGNNYPVVTIGTQTWMAKNLIVTHYPNGDFIPHIVDDSAWAPLSNNLTDDAYSYYTDSEPYFGYFYTYATAIGDNWVKDNVENQGLCPDGWHIPTRDEWITLKDYIGGSYAGGKLKSTGAAYWYSPNEGATNSTGFSAYGAGRRFDETGDFGGSKFRQSYWWSGTTYSGTLANRTTLHYDFEEITIGVASMSDGLNVRCINNNTALLAPEAQFSANTTQLTIGNSINFTDESVNTITSWLWDFGDGNTSTEQNPSYTYSTEGIYTVSLTVSNSTSSDTETKIDYITINSVSAVTVDDYDGNTYSTIAIGAQLWMAENLKTVHYANGTAIPNVSNASDWGDLGNNDYDKAYCWYNDDITNKDIYGALYTYSAATNGDNSGTNVQGVCPIGWHLPSNTDWDELKNYLISNGYNWDGTTTGNKIGKSLAATSGWNDDSYEGDIGNNQTSNNTSGFTALPGGYRANGNGNFNFMGGGGQWWRSNQYTGSTTSAYNTRLIKYREDLNQDSGGKAAGLSVRCIQN